jgi:hypothetical protein
MKTSRHFIAGFEVLTAVTMNNSVSQDIMLCSLLKVNVSEEHITIFLVEEYGNHEASMKQTANRANYKKLWEELIAYFPFTTYQVLDPMQTEQNTPNAAVLLLCICCRGNVY